ncbi:MAG: fluoride efflux transporter CrcB [Rhodobacteraceae bacterium]|nr:fluoride efflux transporter CrcB [Paracoccaceae bacterium]
MNILFVAFGGALGASLRYLVTLGVAFPFGTLVVNVLGSFLMGLAVVGLSSRGLDRLGLLVMTGMLGGFTTFSAFSLDTLSLVESDRIWAAAGYVVASVCLSLLAVFLAVWLARGLASS